MRGERRTGWVIGVFAAAYVPTVFIADQPPLIDWVGEVVPIIVPALAAWLCGAAARRSVGRERAIWSFLALGSAAWSAGDVAYTILDRTGNVPGPFSLADVGYLALNVTWFFAILIHPSTHRRGLDLAASSVDALTILAVTATATLAYVVIPVAGAGLEFIDIAVLLAYPLGDLALLAAFTFLLARSRLRRGSATSWVGAAVVFLLIADCTFARLSALDAYETGSPTDLFWIAAFAAVGIAAARGLHFAMDVPESETDNQAVSLLGALATVVLVVLAALQRHSVVVGLGASTAALCVLIRRMLFLVQHRRLVREVSAHARASQEAASAKEAFVAEASHQLRTPLTSMRLRLDELNMIGLHDPLSTEYVDELSIEVDRLRRLAERLLTLASTETTWPKQRRDALMIAKEVIDRLNHRAQLTHVRLELEPPAEPAFVVSSPGALEETLTNLLDNAVKFSPSGGTVKIGVTPGEDFVDIWVDDEGPGIDEELCDRLFEPFYRVASQKPGYGLGLAIVKRICDAESVHVSLSMRPQSGTRAMMRWPRSARAEATRV